MRRLFISFSGGETSALMTRLLLTKWLDRYDERVVVFANTGQENEETLEFVERCDKTWGFGVVWVEGDVQHGERIGTKHRIVNFKTASRNGEPFEEVIKKYGIPNHEWLHCTRELKTNPMISYLDSIGWERGTYDTAIGIRADEKGRRGEHVYPLMDWMPLDKPAVNEFWMKQTFRLRLTGYQGNCKWCWKKSLRKHMTLMSENPSQFDFPERMEALYGTVGDEFERPNPATPYPARVFFRGRMSTKDLRAAYEANKDTLAKAEDDSIIIADRGWFPLDVDEGGCMESCEPNFKEAA